MKTMPRWWCVALGLVACGGASSQQSPGDSDIPIQRVTDDVYVLGNGAAFSGGNVAVLVGRDGLLLVDAKGASFGAATAAALRKISDKPVRYVINTHCHGDHVGGNAELQRGGAIVVAHANVYRRLQPEKPIECERGGVGSPDVTFDTELTLHFEDEEIRIVALPVGHTDGDAIVYFKNANVVHTGDAFVTPVPFHSKGAGGTALGLPDELRKIVALVPDDAIVIPGHGAQASLSDIRRTITVLDAVQSAIAQQVRAGKTLEELKAMRVLDPWKDSLGDELEWTLMALYEALASTPPAGVDP
jgi:glyoxylase-like metal-dependent hydrolase (beta-lactamase superfamily II)